MIRAVCLLILTFLLSNSCANNIRKNFAKDGTEKSYVHDQGPFYHGVASGDPLTDRVIIWTRVTPEEHDVISVQWEVSLDKDFNKIKKSGIMSTSRVRDYTVKVDVSNLAAGTVYYYRFINRATYSPVGRTKTAPAKNPSEVNLGIVSCSNYEFGYFNAYNGLADQDLDAILHLGDYIYEYGPGKYGDENFPRKHLPPNELLTLDDYRTRYAQYRLDKGLQKAHQNHPFILIWDDHEIANNAYKTGAQNHQADEGDYGMRKANAKKAYYEWQPIRDTGNDELYRKFSYGNLVDIFMLDERFTGRSEPPADKAGAKEERTMLGAEQLKWFKKNLVGSTATWKVIGNQVIFSPCDLSLVRPDDPVNLDAWDGYAYERDDIRSYLIDRVIKNTIFVTGDTHASWAFEVPENTIDYKESGKSCAIEIATPSITSSNWNESSPDDQVIMAEKAIQSTNPHLKYINGRDHGYTVLKLSRDKTIAQWFYTSDIKQKEAKISMGKELTIQRDRHKFSN